MDDQTVPTFDDETSFWTGRDFKESPDHPWETYRNMAREFDSALLAAQWRQRMFAWHLLEEVLSAFSLDRNLESEVDKLQGETRLKLTHALFGLFVKAGKKVSDEVLRRRVEKLLAEHVAARPRGGRRKKVPVNATGNIGKPKP